MYRLENLPPPVVTFFTNKTQWLGVQWAASAPAPAMLLAAAVHFVNLACPWPLDHPAGAGSGGWRPQYSSRRNPSPSALTFQNPISQINLLFRFVSLSYP